jgi:hypothetical protein
MNAMPSAELHVRIVPSVGTQEYAQRLPLTRINTQKNQNAKKQISLLR